MSSNSQYNWGTVISHWSQGPGKIREQIASELEGQDWAKLDVPRNWNRREPSAEEARRFAELMDGMAYAPAFYLASLDLSKLFGTKKLLDIGGGSGRHSIEIAAKHPSIECTVVELSSMVQAAREYCKDKVKVIGRDILTEALPSHHDTHMYCNTLHMFERKDVLKILRNSFDTLTAGGTVMISNAIIDDSGISPRNAIYFYVHMFAVGAGQAFTSTQFREMLEEAGFKNVSFLPYHSHYTLVIARKS